MKSMVLAVAVNAQHTFSKVIVPEITLVAGYGVAGDAHNGVTVKHRSRVARDPAQPNFRQVHMMHAELFDELAEQGFRVGPGEMGENITTRGIDLLALPEGALLRIGQSAVVRVTGLRNPCKQIDGLQKGLMAATLDKAADGSLIRKAGVMGVVVVGGDVKAGDGIVVEMPAGEQRRLVCV